MSRNPSLVIIGTGNTAWQLGISLRKKGYVIKQVFGRNAAHAKPLARRLKCAAVTSLKAIDKEADVYLLAVSDDAIRVLAGSLKLKGRIVVHTSGSVGMDALKRTSAHHGVIYPLQTLSRSRIIDLENVPLSIEYSDPKTKKVITGLAKSISSSVHTFSSQQRAHVHLAAVISGNFSNYLYTLAAAILKKEKIPFSILEPFLLENVRKAAAMGPGKAQTGPAKRGDKKVLKKHLAMLKGDPKLRKLYRVLSAGIAALT